MARKLADFAKQFQDTHHLTPHTQLSAQALADDMLYAIDDQHLELSQGQASPMRGWGVAGIISLFGMSLFMLAFSFNFIYDQILIDGLAGVRPLYFTLPVFSTLATLLCGFVCMVIVIPAFFGITDTIVRVDPLRRKVWIWHAKQPVEIDWDRLTPQLSYSVASAYASVRIHHGYYVELDEHGKLRFTGQTPHAFRVGPISSDPAPVLAQMEFVRRYMEEGVNSVRRPRKLLTHKAKWTALINIVGLADEWENWRLNQNTADASPPPTVATIIAVLTAPVWLPLQFTNWLALVVAPRPRWPAEFQQRFNQPVPEWRKHATTRLKG